MLTSSGSRRHGESEILCRRVFAPRYLQPLECPAVFLKKLLEEHSSGDWFRDLCLIYIARSDDLVRDVVSAFFREARDEGRISLSVDVRPSTSSARRRERGMMAHSWSEGTKKKIARGLIKLLTEFGFLAHRARGPREIRSSHRTPFSRCLPRP